MPNNSLPDFAFDFVIMAPGLWFIKGEDAAARLVANLTGEDDIKELAVLVSMLHRMIPLHDSISTREYADGFRSGVASHIIGYFTDNAATFSNPFNSPEGK